MVYLDNAATTKSFPEVVDAMASCQDEFYGNPSSTHAIGRKARAAIELARKDIASLIGASSTEIIFTSGGTEADNIFIRGISKFVNHVICSPLEHPAVLNTVRELESTHCIDVSWLKIDQDGSIDDNHLEETLASFPGSLLIIMHGNNEIGNLTDLTDIAKRCTEHNILFFTDAVQTMGHYAFDLSSINISGMTASAHKFHGPKGVGFLYLKKGSKISGLYTGGEQERGLRVGTENVAGIVGMAKALEICYKNLVDDQKHIRALKKDLIDSLTGLIPGITFNGTSAVLDNSLNSILSVSFPPHQENDMLLFSLDLAGVAASAGSACASGAVKESHVMNAIGSDPERAVVRFSISRMNTSEDIKFTLAKIAEIFAIS